MVATIVKGSVNDIVLLLLSFRLVVDTGPTLPTGCAMIRKLRVQYPGAICHKMGRRKFCRERTQGTQRNGEFTICDLRLTRLGSKPERCSGGEGFSREDREGSEVEESFRLGNLVTKR